MEFSLFVQECVGIGAVFEAHERRYLGAKRCAVELDRLFAAALEGQVRLNNTAIIFCTHIFYQCFRCGVSGIQRTRQGI